MLMSKNNLRFESGNQEDARFNQAATVADGDLDSDSAAMPLD